MDPGISSDGAHGARCTLCGGAHSALEPCGDLARQTSETLSIRGSGQTMQLRVPAVNDDELIGTTLGNFRIVRLLGRGGMGAVYLGEHTVIGSRVAIKFLHPHLASDKSLVERFFAEAKATNLIGHENIVNVFDLGLLPPNRYYMVMEYLEGQPLSSLVGKPLEPQLSLPILIQTLDALHAAHAAGVIHRDLKPENVFLTRREGSSYVIKLVDFGIAKLGGAGGTTSQTSVGLAVGTPEYMSPEQWEAKQIDGRADIYAVGVLAFLMATGRLPFQESAPLAYYVAHGSKQPPSPRSLQPAISPELEGAILKALAKKPGDRFQSASEMRQALQSLLAQPAAAPAAQNAAPPPVEAPANPSARPQPQLQQDPAPVPAPAPVRAEPPAAPSAPQAPAPLTARVNGPGIAGRELKTADLSRGGVFLCSEPPLPALFVRLQVTLLHPGGTVELGGEVVRHVLPEQARAWGMSPGFAVQFSNLGAEPRTRLDRVLSGHSPGGDTAHVGPMREDAVAASLLGHYRKRCSGDLYALLGLEMDAECSEIRTRARQAAAEIEALRARQLSVTQLEQVREVLERINAAVAALGTPARRAQHDAGRGNFRGVARCLAAGLGVEQLESLRREFLGERPKNETTAQLQVATANAYLANGEQERSLKTLEGALVLDPLNLGIHQKYWTLMRRLAQPGTGGAK